MRHPQHCSALLPFPERAQSPTFDARFLDLHLVDSTKLAPRCTNLCPMHMTVVHGGQLNPCINAANGLSHSRASCLLSGPFEILTERRFDYERGKLDRGRPVELAHYRCGSHGARHLVTSISAMPGPEDPRVVPERLPTEIARPY
jgi:hypothetical protein